MRTQVFTHKGYVGIMSDVQAEGLLNNPSQPGELGFVPMDIWTGLWPGIKECYEQKLIAYGSGGEGWVFDLNTYYANKLSA